MANPDYTRVLKKTYTRKDWPQDLIDWAEANEMFREAIQPIIHGVMLEASQDAMQQVGGPAGRRACRTLIKPKTKYPVDNTGGRG